jgi:hypothetical protein
MNKEQGSITPQLLVMLLVLFSFVSGITAYLRASYSYELKSRSAENSRARLESAVDEMIEALKADHSPELDSPSDPAFAISKSRNGLVSLKIEDESSKLNPNLIDQAMFEKTDLKGFIISGEASDIASFREKNGLVNDTAAFSTLFKPETLNSLTVFGWANVNVIDRNSLGSLFLALTGSDSGADSLLADVASMATVKKFMNEPDLDKILGSNADALRPVIAASPYFNVHFIDANLLKSVLANPDFKISGNAIKAEAILQHRGSSDISQADLKAILGVKDGNKVLQYLGVQTWFFRIRAEEGPLNLEVIVARDPRSDGSGNDSKRTFAKVERRFR